MIENWGIHIRRLRKLKGLSQKQLAERSGLGRGHIARIETGAYKGAMQKTIDQLAKGLAMSIGQLNEEMYGKLASPHKELPEDILDRFRLVLPATVPIYRGFRIHAGQPAELMDYVAIIRERSLGRNLEGYIAHGNCLEPEVKDGDIIIIDRDGQIDNGDLIIFIKDNEINLARLRKIADELYVENNYGRSKLNSHFIAAPVIEVRRRLK